jgi:hypothetical protein
VKKLIFATFLLASLQMHLGAQDKVLYDLDMGPETPIDPKIEQKPHGLKYQERDQNFDEPGGEADWPGRHEDAYPVELFIEIDE